MVMSLTFPTEISSTQGGVQLRLSARGVCWYDAPRDVPITCAKAPFCAGRRTMCLDAGGIDGDRTPDAAAPGQSLENAESDALPARAIEAVIDCCVGAILDRAIALPRADPQHMDDARDHPPLVYPMRPAPSAWQKRFDTSPLCVAQPGQRSHHAYLRSTKAVNQRYPSVATD